MAKIKLETIERRVEILLAENPLLREDDYLLYSEYIKTYRPELIGVSLLDALAQHYEYKLPSYDGITRARRKLQAKSPELRSVTAAQARADKQNKYIKYSQC